ncbi:MAG: hypothetical protein KAX05_07555 [Bacteroidales bacterium]|nr:hypothetical protein [Bacteroidales bacterium]
MISITSLTVIIAAALTLTACTRSTDTTTVTTATPKVDRVIPLADDPIATAPGVFFTENFEIINDLNVKFHDTGGLSDSLMRISSTDAFSGTKAAQNTYISKEEFPEGADPGGSGWFWYFFGDNNLDSNIPVGDTMPRTRVFARWYHKFEEGFTPQEDSGTLPPKMARMRCFKAPWKAVYTVLFWIEGTDGHISIQQHTRAPGVWREWMPNYNTTFPLNDPENIGRWIHFELGVTLGEGHRSDRVQAWADGKLICDIYKQDLAGGYREQTLNGMSWDCYWNGGAPRAESRFYDDLVLSGQPIGPARISVMPTVRKAPFIGEEGQKQKEWQIEVAQTNQVPISINDLDSMNPEMQYLTVWSGTVAGKTDTVTISAHHGEFAGPLKGKKQLDYNTLYSIRLRLHAKNSQWSDWSP